MNIIDICQTKVATIDQDAYIQEAAKILKSADVGSLVVVENDKPVGIITDRDIVIKIIAKGYDCSDARVCEYMTRDVITVDKNSEIDEVMSIMSNRGIRRIPVVDMHGKLSGIISLDDLCLFVEKEQDEIANIIRNQIKPNQVMAKKINEPELEII